MTALKTTTASIEQQLLSKEAISLPSKERLDLLLKTKRYPIVRKRTSAKRQIEEMIDFYNLCSFMLAQYFPDEQSKSNFILLNFIISRDDSDTLVPDKLVEAFRVLNSYEELENKISAIQMLFHQYQSVFPDIYQLYNLDNLANEKMSDIIKGLKELTIDNSSYIEKLMKRWELS